MAFFSGYNEGSLKIIILKVNETYAFAKEGEKKLEERIDFLKFSKWICGKSERERFEILRRKAFLNSRHLKNTSNRRYNSRIETWRDK